MPAAKPDHRSTLAGAQSAVEARLRELDEALAAVAGLEQERDRLREALKLLGGGPAAKPAARSGARARPKRRAASSSNGRYRNRDAIIAHLRAQPGSEAGAIVAATGINRGVAYNLLGRLVKQRLIVKEAGPSQRARYSVAADAPADA